MSETPQLDGKRKSGRYQYSLRSLAVFVAIVCVALAWVTRHSRPRLEFRRAVAPILEMGGRTDGNPSLGPESVTYVFFNDVPLSDTDLETLDDHLKSLNGLRWLTIFGPQVTDVGLEHLKGLTNLETLCIFQSQITDDGLGQLAKLTNLKTLCLGGAPITDAGLVHLEALRDLRDLGLDDTLVTDQGVNGLQESLPDCRIHR